VLEHVSDEAEYEPGLPVHLAVDPGYAGAYAVLALQVVDDLVYVVDEVYRSGVVAEDIICGVPGARLVAGGRGGRDRCCREPAPRTQEPR